MKRRLIDPETSAESAEDNLCRAFLSMRGLAEMRSFLRDLCTPAELEALIDRWRVVPYLLKGVSYREIHERTAVSVTTIGRVARFLSQGNGGYQAAVEHHAVPPLRRRAVASASITAVRTPRAKNSQGRTS
ncbi:MAG: DNA-binding transcriptional regulator [Gammaproteobacteria bacterium]|nr:MAG: DNA-binding transcriptional regulator [Gammaproteobacteria bacterium]